MFAERCSYSCAAVHLQLGHFGIFPRRLIFTIVLIFRSFLASFFLLLISSPVGKNEEGLNTSFLCSIEFIFILSGIIIENKLDLWLS